MSDLEICSKKRNKKGLNAQEAGVWKKVFAQLDDGLPIRSLDFTIDEQPIVAQLPLITAKPLVFACNVDAGDYCPEGNELAKKFLNYVGEKYPGIPSIVLSSLLEEEIVQIRADEGEEAA